jgi:hypothetical protein
MSTNLSSLGPQYFYKDPNGIRCDQLIGLGTPSSVGYALRADDTVASNGTVFGIGVLRSTNYLKLDPAGAPASAEGNVYYDNAVHKLKVRGAAGFETITSV